MRDWGYVRASQVGSGKTSLLLGMLREIGIHPPGTVVRTDPKQPVGYAAQIAYIRNESVRSNILFDAPFDRARYDEVLRACCLEDDLQVLADGDLTEIGERGINLSGGQRQRISLARVMYGGSDLVLLDDPLSAVDAHVGRALFDGVLVEALAGRTRVVVTNQVHLLRSFDEIIVLSNGSVESQAPFAETLEQSATFRSLVASASPSIETADSPQPQPLPHTPSQPQVAAHGAGGAGAELAAAVPSGGAAQLIAPERRDRGASGPVVLTRYMLAGAGSYVYMGALLLVFVLAECAYVAVDTWLSVWASDSLGRDAGWYMSMYAVITAAYFMLQALRSVSLARFGIRAGEQLHRELWHGIVFAPLVFFETTPVGRILNRFAKDIAEVDDVLPDTLQWFLMCLLRVLSILTMVTIASPLFAVALLPLVGLYWYFREYYRRSSRELQRLESLSRSPVFAHFSETLNGLPTIRAFCVQEQSTRKHVAQLQANIEAFFVARTCEVWLELRLIFLGALVVVCCAFSLAAMRDSVSAATAGLALAYALNIVVNLNMSVRGAVNLEAKLNSIERIHEYASLAPQPETVTSEVADSARAVGAAAWPSDGEVVFDAVCLRYRASLETDALDAFSAHAPAAALVGICGRTGAGKSSLMVALLRLVELRRGNITIDGVDIASVPLHVLRSAVSVVSQDPVLFSGTIRSNLDPHGKFSADAIKRCLDGAKLAHVIGDIEAAVSIKAANWYA